MFAYYLRLGLRSLKRNPVLTTLMVLGIGLGVGTSMTTLTVMYLMGSDPIPWKSAKLHYVQVDNWDPERAFTQDGDPPDQTTYRDAVALVEAHKADRQTTMYKVALPVQPENPEVKPYTVTGRATYGDFFAMFEPPFAYGAAWNHDQDEQHARVVVLSDKQNEKLFGGADSVGRNVRINDVDFRIVGVLGEWTPRVKYYDLTNGQLDTPEGFLIPFTTAIEMELPSAGDNNCWKNDEPGWQSYLVSECIWMQTWVELDSPARLAEFRSYLDNYVNDQKRLGRFPRPLNNRLYDVVGWMQNQKVVSSDIEVQSGLSLAFLVVCLLNTVGLLLAKFMRKAGEIGLRRALGASRRQLFAQYMVEAGVIGITGGALGLLLTCAGLWIVRHLYIDFAAVATLDWTMVLATIVLAVVASLLAGLYPTWRACRVVPALQLKTQ